MFLFLKVMLLFFLPTVEAQIVGMSATLNNITDLQTFLHAEHFTNDFRPVSVNRRWEYSTVFILLGNRKTIKSQYYKTKNWVSEFP